MTVQNRKHEGVRIDTIEGQTTGCQDVCWKEREREREREKVEI